MLSTDNVTTFSRTVPEESESSPDATDVRIIVLVGVAIVATNVVLVALIVFFACR